VTISCLIDVLFEKLELIWNICFNDFPAHFNRNIVINLTIMKKKRAIINPNSFRFQSSINSVNVVKYIIGSVNKEACRNSMELLTLVFINLSELPCSHWKISILRNNFTSSFIRNENTSKHVLLIAIVIGWANKGVNLKLPLLLNRI